MSTSPPTVLGLPPFRLALLMEILSNCSAFLVLLFFPRIAIEILLANPSRDLSPSLLTHTQLFGALTVALTVPLVVSYSSPEPGPAGDRQRGFRASTYVTLGAGEVFLSLLFGVKLLQIRQGEDVGWSPTALGMGIVFLMLFGLVRVVFLVWKREWMDNDGSGVAEGLQNGKKGNERKKGL